MTFALAEQLATLDASAVGGEMLVPLLIHVQQLARLMKRHNFEQSTELVQVCREFAFLSALLSPARVVI